MVDRFLHVLRGNGPPALDAFLLQGGTFRVIVTDGETFRETL